MVRTQIQFTEAQHRALKRWAQRIGVSISEIVRRCVAERLASEHEAPSRAAMVREAMVVARKYMDCEGATDVAENHDEYLARAYRK